MRGMLTTVGAVGLLLAMAGAGQAHGHCGGYYSSCYYPSCYYPPCYYPYPSCGYVRYWPYPRPIILVRPVRVVGGAPLNAAGGVGAQPVGPQGGQPGAPGTPETTSGGPGSQATLTTDGAKSGSTGEGQTPPPPPPPSGKVTVKATLGQQKTCPVTGEELGKMGTPVPVVVKGHLIYVCCKGCVAKVKASPDEFLAKVKAERGGALPVAPAKRPTPPPSGDGGAGEEAR